MSKPRVTCPECGVMLALGPSIAAGQKIRCPKCQGVILVRSSNLLDDDDVEPAPPPRRRFKAKKKNGSGGVMAGIVAASVLLVGGAAVGGYMLWKSPKKHKDVVPAAGIGTNVGQLVKEVEAQDIDGVAFKLSDYRGKVVVLDFWGHW